MTVCHNCQSEKIPGLPCGVCGGVDEAIVLPAKGAKKTKPLEPPLTEAELDRASILWHQAIDVMVARGFRPKLFGAMAREGQEFTCLLIRFAKAEALRERDEQG